jgi:hypothetical protein
MCIYWLLAMWPKLCPDELSDYPADYGSLLMMRMTESLKLFYCNCFDFEVIPVFDVYLKLFGNTPARSCWYSSFSFS